YGGISEINGFHRAGAVVLVVSLGVAVVEAAPSIVVGAARHHVLRLRLVAARDPGGRVVSVAGAGLNVDPINGMATEGQLESARARFTVRCLLGPARGSASEVVAFHGLVIDDRNGACRASAE